MLALIGNHITRPVSIRAGGSHDGAPRTRLGPDQLAEIAWSASELMTHCQASMDDPGASRFLRFVTQALEVFGALLATALACCSASQLSFVGTGHLADHARKQSVRMR